MIAGRAYEGTKPSEVDWLGEIPAHWDVKRLRSIASVRNSNVDKLTKRGEERVRLCNYTDVYKRSVIRADDSFMEATATMNEIEAFRLRVDDVIITKDSEDWQDIGVPAYVASTADDLVCGYHLTMLRPRSEIITGRFLYWLLRSAGLRREFSIAARGVTRYGLTLTSMKSVPALVPRPTSRRRSCVPRSRGGTAGPGNCGEAEGGAASGGAEACRDSPRRHPRPRPACADEGQRRPLARRGAAGMGGTAVREPVFSHRGEWHRGPSNLWRLNYEGLIHSEWPSIRPESGSHRSG